MQSAALIHLPAPIDAFSYGASGTQFLPVSGHVTDRLFSTYRASARSLLPLVPAPFSLDVYRGYGFVSVCAVEILGMGIAGAPRFLRFDNREFLYRIAVRLRGQSTFLTLRSDVSSRALAVLGRHFSHYRPRHGHVRLAREGSVVRLDATTRDGSGDAELEADTAAPASGHGSVFADHEEATEFLLGMKFSADVRAGRARVQPIEHGPWHPRFVDATRARFAFLERLERDLGTSFVYDSTLAARDIPQTWKAVSWGMIDFRAPSKRKVAVAVAIMAGTLLYTVASLFGGTYGNVFFSIPIFIGFVSGALSPKRPFIGPLYALGVCLALAVVIRVEGVICVLFALPVLAPGVWLGGFAGSVVVKHVQSRRAQRYTIGMLVFAGAVAQVVDGAVDDRETHPLHVAEASIVVDASPDEVFALLTTGEMRVAPDWPWFLRIGLPMPERMRVEQPGPSGTIRFDFSQGTAFAAVTAWRPGHELRYAVRDYVIRDLPFHITRLGRSPDYGFRSERVQDWLTIEDTRYQMTADSGGTKLTRRIIWRRHLAPDLYFGWLQQTVMSRGQIRLLELIRERARERRRERETSGPTALFAGPSQ